MSVLIRKSDGKRLRGVFDGDLMDLPFVRHTGYPPSGYVFGHLPVYLERPEVDEDALTVLNAAEQTMPPKRRPGDEAVVGWMMVEAFRRAAREPRAYAYKTDEGAARAWAKRNGYRGNGGGWIVNGAGRTACQGWGKLADRLRSSGQIKRTENGWAVA
jgi:hypothetical protein